MNPKLIRDKIPEIVAAQGKTMNVTPVTGREARAALWDKLREEVGEMINAPGPYHMAEEMGDVLTVLYAMADQFGLDWYQDVMVPMSRKADERGEFKAFLIWDGNDPTDI